MDGRILILTERISRNLRQEWVVKDLAESIDLSESHLQRLFKDSTGMSPIKYIKYLRFEKAKALLEGRKFLRIQEICIEVLIKHGAVGDYFFLNLIEIQAIKYTPNLLNQIEHRRVALSNFLKQQNQNNIKSFAKNSNSSNTTKSYGKEDLLKQAETAKTPKAKDYFLYKAAMICVKEEDFDEALKIANRLSENADESTKPYIKYLVARKFIKE